MATNLIWRPRNASDHAPRIRLDRIVATEWSGNGTANELRVYLEGGFMIKLNTHEGNQLLDAWGKYIEAWEADRATLQLQWLER